MNDLNRLSAVAALLTFVVCGCAPIGPLLTTVPASPPVPSPNPSDTSGAPPAAATSTFIPPASATAESTDTPAAAVTQIFVGYDFERDAEGWGSSEGQYKLATITTTAQYHYQ